MAASGAFGADGAAFAGSAALDAGAFFSADLAGAGAGAAGLASLAFGALAGSGVLAKVLVSVFFGAAGGAAVFGSGAFEASFLVSLAASLATAFSLTGAFVLGPVFF
jgi:hypothetical protein